MSEPDLPKRPEVPLGDVFSEVPLFREIQRVLLSSSGPVNWELARQVGIAVASWGQEDPPPADEDRRGLEDTVRAAELHVAEFTGLEPPGEVAPVEALRRAEWVESSILGLKELLEPAAARMGDALGRAQMEGGVPEEAMQMAGAVQFVLPNVAAFEREWSLSPVEFRAWVSLHEVTHRFQFARPWAREHFLDLVRDYVSTLQLDLSGLQERMERLDVGNPEALQSLFQSDEGLLGPVLDDEQRLKLARVQAFMAAAEGYGEHVTERVGRRMLSSFGQIEEAVKRAREGEASDPVFERLLGIEMKREQYRLGQAFCERVVELTDEATLARMWDSAEALPSMPELDEPRLWLARTA